MLFGVCRAEHYFVDKITGDIIMVMVMMTMPSKRLEHFVARAELPHKNANETFAKLLRLLALIV